MVKVNKKLAVALLGVSALAAPLFAAQDVQKTGKNLSDKEAAATASSKQVEQVTLGYRLAEYARAEKDAGAMLVAARMVDAVSLKQGTDKGALKAQGTQSGQGTAEAVTGDSLFAEAKTLAGGDQDMLATIEKAEAAKSKGVDGGAISLAQYVPSNTVWTVGFQARGGEPLLVGTRRDSGTAMDLKVFDENGNLVCEDMSHAVVLGCRVNPIWTGRFTVQVINHGPVGSGVAMVSN